MPHLPRHSQMPSAIPLSSSTTIILYIGILPITENEFPTRFINADGVGLASTFLHQPEHLKSFFYKFLRLQFVPVAHTNCNSFTMLFQTDPTLRCISISLHAVDLKSTRRDIITMSMTEMMITEVRSSCRGYFTESCSLISSCCSSAGSVPYHA